MTSSPLHRDNAASAASPDFEALRARYAAADITVGVIGLGYVGLPLVKALAGCGITVVGFDVDEKKVEAINAGKSYIRHIPSSVVEALVAGGRFAATADFGRLPEADAILICVPTPLTQHREPDLSFVVATAEVIARHIRSGQLVILESTTYPGTTTGVIGPILERSGLKSGTDFYLGYSPEREDPGNDTYSTTVIPKVVGGNSPEALELVTLLYDHFVPRTIPVSSVETAEAVKLTENIFRAVNIALVNELKVVFEPMGIDVWEVIDAAKTKPFGFMPFYPGPGLGGHCIPIDPFYLTWKAREYGISTRFIELAGEINTSMPDYVIEKLARGLDDRFGRGLNGAKILVVGLAYKKNVDDIRESPALTIIERLMRRGADVSIYDPFVPVIPGSREHPGLAGKESIAWSTETLSGFDGAMIVTDHDEVDYQALVDALPLVVDTRNATRSVTRGRERIIKA